MERVKYLLDTNVASDYVNNVKPVRDRLYAARSDGHGLYLCLPVYYEVLRGVFRTNATRKQEAFEKHLIPLLGWIELEEADWRQAARFWAQMTGTGKQLSDVDLLIAVLAVRVNAVIVSADSDFDELPVKRENWREKPHE